MVSGHAKEILERLTICSLVSLTWQGHAPQPPNSCQALKPRRPPGGALRLTRVSRNSQLCKAFSRSVAKSIEVAARGSGHLLRVNARMRRFIVYLLVPDKNLRSPR